MLLAWNYSTPQMCPGVRHSPPFLPPSPSVCSRAAVTGLPAPRCPGSKVKTARQMYQRRTRSKVDEARDILANVVLCHVPVVLFNFQQKVRIPLGPWLPLSAPRPLGHPGHAVLLLGNGLKACGG